MSDDGEDLKWRKFTWSTAGFDARSPPFPSPSIDYPETNAYVTDSRTKIKFYILARFVPTNRRPNIVGRTM